LRDFLPFESYDWRMRRALLAGLALTAALIALPAAAAPPRWTDLFDGRSLAGWRMTGPGSFTVERGALVTHGGMGLLWYERRRFGDFELEVDWRVARQCANSGIFVRFPDPPASPLDAVAGGYEVQIDDCDPDGAIQRTGAIYDVAPARRPASRQAGRWNRYRIRVVGQHYTVFLNGARVNDFDGTRALAGYVGLQNHDPGSRVSFRRVRVRAL
jgi:3-keto-disaccharide hydrolase